MKKKVKLHFRLACIPTRAHFFVGSSGFSFIWARGKRALGDPAILKTSFCAQNFLLRAHNCSTNLVPCIRLCLQRAECQGRCFLPNFFFPITHFIEGIISWYWSCYRDTSWYQIIAQLKNIYSFTVAAACASDSHDLQFALCLSQRDDAVPSTLNWIWAQTEREVVWWADRWDWLVKFLLTKIIIAVPFWPT